MKIKTLTCLVLATMVSAQAFALETHNARIVSHKEWTTTNVRGSFHATKSNALSKAINRDANSTNASDVTINLLNGLDPATGNTSSPVIIKGDHVAIIINHSNLPKTFELTYSLCADTTNKDKHDIENCITLADYVDVDAGGDFIGPYASELQLDAKNILPDEYATYAAIEVKGTGDTVAHMNGVALGKVTISQ